MQHLVQRILLCGGRSIGGMVACAGVASVVVAGCGIKASETAMEAVATLAVKVAGEDDGGNACNGNLGDCSGCGASSDYDGGRSGGREDNVGDENRTRQGCGGEQEIGERIIEDTGGEAPSESII